MKGNGRITGYAVNKKTISVQIELSGAMAVVDELERYKGKMKTIRLDTLPGGGEDRIHHHKKKRGLPYPRGEVRFHQPAAVPPDGKGTS